MRISSFAVFLGVALAFPESKSPDRKGCPYYSNISVEKPGCPYTTTKSRGQGLSTWSRQAQGKDGVFFMNRIAPGTSELFLANADGSHERKLLGNDSTYDYHASFSPDGEWIIFTTERNGDGNSVSGTLLHDRECTNDDRTSIASEPTVPTSAKSPQLHPSRTLLSFHPTVQRSPMYRQPTTTKPTSGYEISPPASLST